MKILTILGTRPEIIRLSQIIPKLDTLVDHVIMDTGQNYSPELSRNLYLEMKVREPDYFALSGRLSSFGAKLGRILSVAQDVIEREKPDKVLILGDTDSSLAAIVAKRLAVPVYHMEAGNRCFDDKVPEEVNRRIIDHVSDVLLPYTQNSKQNLINEGIPSGRILVTGNPINEVMRKNYRVAFNSNILKELKQAPFQYFLVSFHRSENVDTPVRREMFRQVLAKLYDKWKLPVLVSTHPHTKQSFSKDGLLAESRLLKGRDIRFMQPFGFADFLKLERFSKCVLTDSGTVQEECCIMKVPTVTLRDTTERPETIECGSNCLVGLSADTAVEAVGWLTGKVRQSSVPLEYQAQNVSGVVVGILLGRNYVD